MSYSQHNCPKARSKDVQVPVCPLCNQPVASPRNQAPDIAVGQHIDRDCQSDPAQKQRKVCFYKEKVLLIGLGTLTLVPDLG